MVDVNRCWCWHQQNSVCSCHFFVCADLLEILFFFLLFPFRSCNVCYICMGVMVVSSSGVDVSLVGLGSVC